MSTSSQPAVAEPLGVDALGTNDALRPLSEVADAAVDEIRRELARGRSEFAALSDLPECVTIKNAQGVVVYSNAAHRRTFCPATSPVGRTSHAYLDAPMARRSEQIESLIFGGVPFVECEHSGSGPDGTTYRVHAYKRSLKNLHNPGLAVLSLLRVLARDESDETARACDLAEASDRFRALSQRDQDICRWTALGVSSRELGERLGMTTRGIELRKQKAFAHLGVAKAVDLARLLTRLQDRGHLDLGI